MSEKRSNLLLSALFFVIAFLSLLAVLSFNIDMTPSGFVLGGSAAILIAVVMAGSAIPAWGMIGGLLCVGFYLIARGMDYLSQPYLRYATIALLLGLMVVYGISFFRQYKDIK